MDKLHSRPYNKRMSEDEKVPKEITQNVTDIEND